MKQEKVKDLLYRTTELIPEPEIQSYVRSAFENASSEFFQAPTSSSGKYHPVENNIIGGLTGMHTVKAALYGHDFAAHSCPQHKGIVIAGCLLHDIRKGNQEGGEWDRYAIDHALQAHNWLEQFELVPEYKDLIRASVRTHMSDLTSPEDEKELALDPYLPLVNRIVQFADQAASFMWASFIPGVDCRELLEMKVEDSSGVIDELMNLDNLQGAIDKLWGSRKRVKG